MKDIEGYEGLYAITKDGKVWAYPKIGYESAGRWKEGRFLKPWLIGNGYEMVSLYNNKVAEKILIHRLVASTYIPNPQNLREVNHLNEEKLDNRISNLEWVSSKENKQHTLKRGGYRNLGKNTPKGSNFPTSKLIESQVIEIRRLYWEENKTQRVLASEFNVSHHLIQLIVNRKVWKHI